jgi:hypothetical protein
MPLNKRKARILTNVKISEVSVVDRGAGEGCHVVLRKRDDDHTAIMRKFERIFGVKKKDTTFGGYAPTRQKNLDVHTDPDGPINPGGAEPDDDDDADFTEHLSNDADAGDDDESDADEINDTSGEPTRHLNELAEQLDKQQKDNAMKSKSLDVIKVCKAMAADGDAYGTSEHELVDWLDRYAKAHDTTFVALYERGDDVGLAIRKAITIAKNAQFLSRTATLSKQSSSMFHAGDAGYFTGSGKPGRATLVPRVTGGKDAGAVNNPKSALDQLNELVAEQRRANPTLTEAGAFAQVYAENPSLAEQERKENRPVATSW